MSTYISHGKQCLTNNHISNPPPPKIIRHGINAGIGVPYNELDIDHPSPAIFISCLYFNVFSQLLHGKFI